MRRETAAGIEAESPERAGGSPFWGKGGCGLAGLGADSPTRKGPPNSDLNFFSSPEGRVAKTNGVYEYQYSVADHQGNTRAIITSVTPAAMDITATFEGNSTDNKNQFSNVSGIVTSTAANHTSGGNKVIRMNQNYKVGPGKSIKVYPGDLVDTEVWTYYEATTGYGTSSPTVAAMVTAIAAAFGGASGGGGESGSIYDGVNSALGVFGLGGNAGNTAPAAYLNYILYDQQYKVLDMGWTIVPTSANFAKVKITLPQLTIKEAGFVFVYLSYEDQSNNYVYFDDFRVTHTKSNIIQASEYYPLGMQTANSWTRESVTANNFLGNGGTELNQTSQLYDLEFRNYDPTLGRMYGVDPVAGKYSSLTPYNYSFNNPVNENDPSGADPYPTSSNSNLWYNNGAGAYGYPGLSYDDFVPPIGNGQFFVPVSSFYQMASGDYGNMDKYWHPGDGRIFWGGYESAAREYRHDEDRVRYRDMTQEQFDEKYEREEEEGSNSNTTGFVLDIDWKLLPDNSSTHLFFKNGKYLGGIQFIFSQPYNAIACATCPTASLANAGRYAIALSASDGALPLGEIAGLALITTVVYKNRFEIANAVSYSIKLLGHSLMSKHGRQNVWPDEYGNPPNTKDVDWTKSDSQLADELSKENGDDRRGPTSSNNIAKKWFRDKRPRN